MGKAATVKLESAVSIAAVCLGSSTVPATVMIVVEYRLVYQLISKSQAATACSGGSTVPAAVVIVVKYRACLSIGRLIIAIQAQSFIVIAGTAALSVCQWYVAVRC